MMPLPPPLAIESQLVLVGRVVPVALLGAVVGLEREWVWGLGIVEAWFKPRRAG